MSQRFAFRQLHAPCSRAGRRVLQIEKGFVKLSEELGKVLALRQSLLKDLLSPRNLRMCIYIFLLHFFKSIFLVVLFACLPLGRLSSFGSIRRL